MTTTPQPGPPPEPPPVQQINVRSEAPRSAGGSTPVIVGIVALVAVLALVYLVFLQGRTDPNLDLDVNLEVPEVEVPDVTIEVPEMEVPDLEIPDEITVEIPEGE